MKSNWKTGQIPCTQHVSLGLFATAVVYASLFTTNVRGMGFQDTERTVPSPTKNENIVGDAEGPTIALSYSRETFKQNPISSFMYFVPLISLTDVDRQTSADNVQEVGIVSYEKKIRARSFFVACEFEIRGKGFHKNTFDSSGMIAAHSVGLRKDETLKGMLDYVIFEGAGLGRIEVRGTIDGVYAKVNQVDLRFNVDGHESPVTIGLYDIEPVDGQYKYENRSKEAVARVNTLSFERSSGNPTMGIGVASIRKATASEGFFSRIKGAIANMVITPPRIEELGNETMLKLGHALLDKDPQFTFPLAKNLVEDKLVQP